MSKPAPLAPELFVNVGNPGQPAPQVLVSLTQAISTTPPPGTVETYTVSGPAPYKLQSDQGQFRITIGSEIMMVMAASVNNGNQSWQFVRGAEGSTISTHANGSPIYHVQTADAMEGLRPLQNAPCITVLNTFQDPRGTTAANFAAVAPALDPPPPPNPVAIADTSAGTLPVNTWYQVEITYVTAAGETLPSTMLWIETLGGTNNQITVQSPPAKGGVTGYYVYIAKYPVDAQFYRQQAVGSPTPIGTNFVLNAERTTTGVTIPATNTTAAGTITENPTHVVDGFQQLAVTKSAQEVTATPGAGSYVGIRTVSTTWLTPRFGQVCAARAAMRVTSVAAGMTWHAALVMVYYDVNGRLSENIIWTSPQQTTTDSTALSTALGGTGGWFAAEGWDNMTPLDGSNAPSGLYVQLECRIYHDGGTAGAVTLRATEFTFVVDPNGDVPTYIGGDNDPSLGGTQIAFSDTVDCHWLGTADNSNSLGNIDPVGMYPAYTGGQEFGFNNYATPTAGLSRKQSLKLLKELGVTLSRENAGLSGGQASPLVLPSLPQAQLDWLIYLANNGISLLLQFGSPSWMHTTSGYMWPTDTTNQNNFAQAVLNVIAAIGPDKIWGIQVGNEPNNGNFSGGTTSANDPASFVTYSNIVHDAVKAQYPGIKFLGGTLSASFLMKQSNSMQASAWYKAAYTAGLKADYIDYHPYPVQSKRSFSGTWYAGSSAPNPNAAGGAGTTMVVQYGMDQGFDGAITELKNAMAANGDTRQIFLSESGQLASDERIQGQVMALIMGRVRRDPSLVGVCFNGLMDNPSTSNAEWSTIDGRTMRRRHAARQLALMQGMAPLPIQESDVPRWDSGKGMSAIWGNPYGSPAAFGATGPFSANYNTPGEVRVGYFGATVILGGQNPGESNVVLQTGGWGDLAVGGRIRVTGQGSNPTSGKGIELAYADPTGEIFVYDRAASLYKSLVLWGSQIAATAQGTNPGFLLQSSLATGVIVAIKGGAGQSGDLLQLQDSSGNVLLQATSAGKLTQYEPTFSNWKTLPNLSVIGAVPGAQAAGTYVMYYGGVIALGGNNSSLAVFYLDPSDYTASTRTTKVRIRASLLTTAVAPGVNVTAGLYPVTGFGGASAAYPTVTSVGTAVCSVTFTTQAASTQAVLVSSVVNFPAAGYYVLGLVLSGASAASSNMSLMPELQYQQV